MVLKRMSDIDLDHREYLEFLNAANSDNDDWVPFDTVESLRTILFSNPEYDANRHLVVMVDKTIAADLFIKIRSRQPGTAEMELNIAADSRGKGLGERLLSAALKLLDQTVDTKRIILSPGNHEILSFAEAHGFRVSVAQVDMAHDLELLEPARIPSGYEIRPVDLDQLEEVTKLRNQIFHLARRAEELEVLMVSTVITANVIAGIVDNEIVGYCIAQIDSRSGSEEGLIAEIGVREEHRRKGIGKAMLLMNLDWLKSKGCKKATVSADSTNVSGLGLCKRTGFRAFGTKNKILEKKSRKD